MTSTDILLHSVDRHAVSVSRTKLAAFVPITIAIAGVLFIIAGGISASPVKIAETQGIDPIITGAVLTTDPAAIRMLDD